MFTNKPLVFVDVAFWFDLLCLGLFAKNFTENPLKIFEILMYSVNIKV